MKHLYFMFVLALGIFAAPAVMAQNAVDTVSYSHNYYCDFEDSVECSAWTLVNGGMTNSWYLGTAVNNTWDGSKSLYISNNGGASHVYNNTSSSTVYAYRDVYLEAGFYILYYEWKCGGYYSNDFILSALVPGSVQFTPSAGLPDGLSYNGLPDGWINTGYKDYNIGLYGSSSWWSGIESRVEIPESGVYHLVYVWHNNSNSSGENPPAAIDNINMHKVSCPWVKNLRMEASTDSSITVAWTPQGDVSQWHISGAGDTTISDTIFTINGLEHNTRFWINVYPECDNNYWNYGTSIEAWTDCGIFSLPYEDNNNTDDWKGFRRCCYKGGTYYNLPYVGWTSYIDKNLIYMSAYYSLNSSGEYTYFALPDIRDSLDNMVLECDFINTENSITYTSLIVVGVMSNPEDFSTFVGIDTIDMHDEDPYTIYHYKKNFNGYGIYGNYIAFVAPAPQLYGDTYAYNHYYIDNILVTDRNACSYITDLKATAGEDYVTLDWKETGTATNWLIRLTNWIFDSSFTVQDTHVVITGLDYTTNYTVYLSALCSNGDTGTVYEKWFNTLCAPIQHSELPYYNSFEDSWNDGNGNIYWCWRCRNNTGYAYSPQISGGNAHNGNNVLYYSLGGNNYSYAVLPLFEDSLSNLALSFYARYYSNYNNARLVVGVMSNPDDIATFDTVEVFELEPSYQTYSVVFDSFAVDDKYIALLCYSANNEYTIMLIDDIMVTEKNDCDVPIALRLNSNDSDTAVLSWVYSSNATQFEVAWDYGDFDPNYASHIDTATSSSLLLTGFAEGTNHIVAYARPLCQGNTTLWQGPVECYLGIVTVPTNSNDTLRGCQFTIFDDGHINNYSDNADGSLLLLPPDSTKCFAISGTYNTESCCDHLYIYDGSTTNSPLLAQVEGIGTLDTLYSHGPMLIYFHTDASVTRDGFELNVNCIDAPTCSQVATVSVERVSASSALVSWTMLYPDITQPDSLLVRWADTTGNIDSLYTTGTSCTLIPLAPSTFYTVSVTSYCSGMPLQPASTVFRTRNYGCLTYDTTQTFFDTILDNNSMQTTSYLPTYSYYNYSVSQQLYLNTELSGGLITNISLMPEYVIDNRTFRIYLAHTAETDLTHIINPSDMTLVYTGGETELTAYEWVEFELTMPFYYNGSDNLLVTFVDTTGHYISSNRWYCHPINHHSVYVYRDSSPFTIEDAMNYGSYSNSVRNNIVFSNSAACDVTASCTRPDAWITEIGYDHIGIAWMPDSCAHTWDVAHRELWTEQWITDLTATTLTAYTFSGLQSYTDYQFRIIAGGDTAYTTILNGRTKCSPMQVPFVENFTNVNYGDNSLPVCWNKKYANRAPWISGGYSLRGYESLYFYSNYEENYFTLPKLEAPMDSLTLYFSMMNNTSGNNRSIQVGVVTNPDDISTFHLLGTAQAASNYEWENFNFSLAGMPDGNIAFVSSNNTYNYLYFDAIEVLYNSSCSRPEGVHVTHRTATTATVEWTPTGASEYIVVCRNRWDDLDSGITVVTQNPRASFTGLSGGQDYRVLITAVCAPGDTSYTSIDYIFTTACSINEVPFTEPFENYNYGTSSHAPTCWYYGSYNTSYPFISRSYNHTDNGYNSMYLYCFDKNHEGKMTYLMMPELELDTLTVSQLQAVFYGYAQGTASQHQLIVGVCDTANNMNTFIPVDTLTMTPDVWDIYEVTFDSYTGTGKYITFVSMVEEGSKYSYPYIDDLTIEPIPPCQRPNELYANEEGATANTIEIGWNDRSEATQWIVEYGDKGFTPGTGTQVVADSNPFTLTGIHRGYAGEFYVRAICSTDDSSGYSRRPCPFKTVCDTMSDIVVACDSYTWHGTTYTSTITGPLYDAPDIPSCDSLVVLHLTMKYSTTGTDVQTACDSYSWYDNTYTASTNTPTHTLTNAVGCDSVITLNLTVNYSTQGTETVTACDSYTWYGNTYTASTTSPTHTLTNAVNCDSTAHLALTVNYSTTATEQVTTCDRSSYIWRGRTFTESTDTATFTMPNAIGCDSVITLHLNMSQSRSSIETVTACDSYTWNGTTYTASTDTPTKTVSTVVGCDSTVTLHLTVNYSNAATDSHTACDSYAWHGTTYTASTTTPTYTSTNTAGCDSVTTLNLTILNSTTGTDAVTACDSYTWHGTTYTASISTPTFIMTNAVGCDSVITLNLTVNYSNTGTLTLTACDSYTWHGTTYTASTNTPTWLTLNNAGCDSLVTLNLTVNYSNTGIDNQVACDSYTWHGTTYTASTTTPTYTSTNIMGCDSTTTLHLTVNYSNTGIETVSECDSYLWHGTVYTASTNTPTFTSTNAAGCDSVTTLHLTLNYSSSSIDNVNACDSYRWHGVDYTSSTSTPTFATSNAVGCDSTVVLHLTVNYSNTGTETVIACDSYTWHGITFTVSDDTSTYTATNVSGCDSVVTLNLTVNYSSSSTETTTACDSYTWHGTAYTASTSTATFETTNAVGCDSTITLNLTVNYSTASADTAAACDSYVWNGTTYSSDTVSSFTTTNVVGCDSTVTLILTMGYSNSGEETVTLCDYTEYTWNGTTYTASTDTATYTTTNADGCDSTVTLHLTLNYSTTSTEPVTVCDSITWHGTTYTASTDSPTFTTTNAVGCDSTITLILTVNYSTQTTISDTAVNSYEWNGTTYTESGTYTWTGTGSNGCDSTVTLHLFIEQVGINTVDDRQVNVYPNPTSGILHIDAEGVTEVEVYDLSGRLVAHFNDDDTISLANLPAGSYTLRIRTEQGNYIRRIILKP